MRGEGRPRPAADGVRPRVVGATTNLRMAPIVGSRPPERTGRYSSRYCSTDERTSGIGPPTTVLTPKRRGRRDLPRPPQRGMGALERPDLQRDVGQLVEAALPGEQLALGPLQGGQQQVQRPRRSARWPPRGRVPKSRCSGGLIPLPNPSLEAPPGSDGRACRPPRPSASGGRRAGGGPASRSGSGWSVGPRRPGTIRCWGRGRAGSCGARTCGSPRTPGRRPARPARAGWRRARPATTRRAARSGRRPRSGDRSPVAAPVAPQVGVEPGLALLGEGPDPLPGVGQVVGHRRAGPRCPRRRGPRSARPPDTASASASASPSAVRRPAPGPAPASPPSADRRRRPR